MIPRYFLATLLMAGLAGAAHPTNAGGELQERLRHRLEVLDHPGELVAGGDLLYAVPALVSFYEGRTFRPAWLDADGQPSDALQGLVPALQASRNHGLTPSHYHLGKLRNALALLNDPPRAGIEQRVLADIELLASDAFLTLADHYAGGKVHAESIDPGWFLEREAPELASSLSRAVAGGKKAPRAALNALLPVNPAYQVLVEHLALQRKLSGDGSWEEIQPGRTLHPGDTDAGIPALRKRLALLGDYLPPGQRAAAPEDLYGDGLQDAVRRFQARHGLENDGIIGRDTLRELNVAPASRGDQIRANLERWRWLPRSLGDEYILVNIAGFRMDVFSGDDRVMQQRVIVGQPYRRTPVFTGRMTYLVLNPAWEVPHRLAVQDKLPEITRDPEYLSRLGFTVLQGWGAEETVIDPETVDWNELSRSHFPYRLRQAPGPQNALGQVKFMFPNVHNVYLHDTPTRGLFAEDHRAFSSGCIRVEDPLALAEWLLGGTNRQKVMTREEIHRILDVGKESTVPLESPVDVHMLYWTAWVEDDGTVQFRGDIYGTDTPLTEVLSQLPPGGS
jgi:murein L,D-transpeptidase YcbB/YkuD